MTGAGGLDRLDATGGDGAGIVQERCGIDWDDEGLLWAA